MTPNNLRDFRGDLTQHQLAERIGPKTSAQQISAWESGRVTPTIPTQRRILKALHVGFERRLEVSPA